MGIQFIHGGHGQTALLARGNQVLKSLLPYLAHLAPTI
jgi:hypothetical protein